MTTQEGTPAGQAARILDVAPLGVYVVDEALRLRYVNPVAMAAWGASPEVIGRDFSTVVVQVFRREYADEILRIFRTTLATGESYSTPGISKPRADRDVTEHYEWSVARVKLPECGFGLVCFFRDISKDVEARARIEESEEALRRQLDLIGAITSNATTALFIMDEHQRCVFMNEAAEKLTGYTLDEVKGAPLHNFVHHTHPDGRPYPLEECPIDRAFPERNQMQGEEVFVHKDGSFYAVAFTASPLRRRGRVEGTIIEVQDIRQRNRAEHQLRLSEARFRALITATSDSFYRMSPDWKQMWQLTGQGFLADSPEPDAHWLEKYIPAQEHQRVLETIAEAIRTKSLFELEHQVFREDGSVGWAYSRAAPLFDTHGEITEWFGAGRDITERKEGELRFERSQRKFVELVEHAPFGLYVVDSNLRITQMNLASRHHAFKNVQPVIGRDLEEAMRILWPEATAADVVTRFRHTLMTGEPYLSGLFENTRRDEGRRETYEWELHRVTLADGSFGVVCYYFDTTKLWEAERALRENEERIRVASENAEIGFWEVDVVNDRLIWSPRTKLLFGVEKDPLPLSMADLYAMIHPEDLAAMEEKYRAAVDPRRRATYDAEYRVIGRDDGRMRWLAAKGRGVFDEQGRCIRTLGTITDITKRKATEEALLESEARFRELANNISQFAWMADENGELVWFNQRWYDYTGTTPDEMMNGGWQKVHHPDFMKRVTAGWQNCIEKVTEWEDTFPLRGKHGEWRWFLSRAQPIRDEHGRIVRWFGTNTDITDQRNAEISLAESEARYRMLAEQVADGIFVTDKDGRYIDANRAASAMLGYSHEELLTLHTADVLEAKELSRIPDQFAALQTGQAVKGDWEFRRKNGSSFVGELIARQFPDGRMQGVVRDVTERRRVEDELRRANADLEQFAYSASHDMQEPIRNIAVYSEMLEARYSSVLDERGKQFIRLVNESALRMDALVKDLLIYAQSGSDDKEDAREADAEVALQVTLQNLATNIEKSRAVITHDPLPKVAISPGHLQQLLQNLLANALKYRRDEVAPQIEIGAERSGAMWKLHVRDNGIGIEPRYQAQVFGLFKRLHSGGKYAGAGMGLAICQKIVERRGGRIWVESEGDGRGSTFYFTLPAA